MSRIIVNNTSSSNNPRIDFVSGLGLYFIVYSGYMNDNPNFFDNNTTYKTGGTGNNFGSVLNISSINAGTNGFVPGNSSMDSYSVQWLGYFKPDVTGTWTFFTNSDDCSYLWIGVNALSGYTTTNATINNSGIHGPIEVSGTATLTAGVYYPIRIQMGDNFFGDGMIVSFQGPAGSAAQTKRTDGTGFYTNDGFIDVSNNNFEFGTFSNNVSLLTNNTKRLTVINVGNVGIATTNPLYTLDVSGTGNFNGDIVCQGSFVGNSITTGVNWRTINVGLDAMYGIAYGNGMFVVCNDGSSIYYSIDGINWTIGFGVGGYNRGINICFGNGVFVIICRDYQNTAEQRKFVYITTDAINSINVNLSSYSIYLRCVCYGNNQFVIVCDGGTNRALTSVNGINWTVSATSTGFDNSWNSVCYGYGIGGGKFIAVAPGGNNTSNRSMTSTDGYNWTLKTTTADNGWNSICYGNGKFVAVGNTGSNRVMTTDGSSNWTLVSTGETTETWSTICYGNGLYVAAATGGNYRKMISRDAVNWTLLPLITDGYYEQYNSICYGNGMFIISRTYNGAQQLALLSVSGYPTITTSPGTNIRYDILYINKQINIYDNSTYIGNSGLQSASQGIHIWSMVSNSNYLAFSSYAGHIFKTNCVNSLYASGNTALYSNSNGNVGIGKLSANYNLDVSGTLYSRTYSIFSPNQSYSSVDPSTNTYALTVGDSLTDASINTLSMLSNGIVNIVRPNDLNRAHLSLTQYNTTTTTNEYWQMGYVNNGLYSSTFGIFGPGGRFQSQPTAMPCLSMYSINNTGLANYYPFDSAVGTTTGNYATVNPVFDCSLNGLNGGATIDTADYKVGGGSLSLIKTSSQYAQINTSFTVTSAGLSFACWFKANGNSGDYARIFDFGNGEGYYNILMGFLYAGTQLFCAVYGNGTTNTNDITVYYNASLSGNIWFHVVWTLNPNGVWKFYINGSLVNTITGTVNYYPAITTAIITRNSNYIGRSNWPNPYFNGKIDDFRVYNRVLSDSEAANIYSTKATFINNVGNVNSVGINTNAPAYHLDVSGTVNISGNLTSGNLTCSSLYIPNIIRWYITRDVSANISFSGNVGATSNGFGNVYVNGSTVSSTTGLATAWNTTTATFTAPYNGVYMFQLNVYMYTVVSYGGSRNLVMRGTGTQGNNAQYSMFEQIYSSTFGAFTITNTWYMTTNQTIYYETGGITNYYTFGKNYTNLQIIKIA